jgi:hypothetical protein
MRSVEAVWELEDLGNGGMRASYRFRCGPRPHLGVGHPRAGGDGDPGDLRQRTSQRAQAGC